MIEEPEAQFQLNMPFMESLEQVDDINIEDIEESEVTGGKAAPFVKWAGGKRSIINDLKNHLPHTFGAYYEPFVGGGALFFELCDKLPAAYLSDMNQNLIFAYQAIKKDPDQLIALLDKHAAKHNKEYYYEVRGQYSLQNPVELAARFLYLNKTCYNGLYRENKKGEFNVPIGSYKNPNVVQADNIRACSTALQNATIRYGAFESIEPKSGDFVYFDPPYHPTDDTSFTSYTSHNFTEKDQVKLRDFALELHRKGVQVMLSNSNTKFITNLYKDKPFRINFVNAPRYVNCKPNGRNDVEEVLITTYER
jgi:DNA adenine methylase